jgi:hypothetical protein
MAGKNLGVAKTLGLLTLAVGIHLQSSLFRGSQKPHCPCTRVGATSACAGPRFIRCRQWHCVLLARMASTAHIGPMLPDEQPTSEQLDVLRAMSGQERLRVAEGLYWSARKMKAAGVQGQHPDWPEARVEVEVRRIFRHART